MDTAEFMGQVTGPSVLTHSLYLETSVALAAKDPPLEGALCADAAQKTTMQRQDLLGPHLMFHKEPVTILSAEK